MSTTEQLEQIAKLAREKDEEFKKDQEQREAVILTNACVPMFLNGRELKARCPEDKDYTELNEWVKSRFIVLAREACKSLPPIDRREMLDIAIRAVMGVTWISEDGQRIVNSTDGIAYIAYVMLRDQNPDITYEWLQEACSREYNIEEVGRVFNYFNEQLEKLSSNGATKKTSSGSVPAKN